MILTLCLITMPGEAAIGLFDSSPDMPRCSILASGVSSVARDKLYISGPEMVRRLAVLTDTDHDWSEDMSRFVGIKSVTVRDFLEAFSGYGKYLFMRDGEIFYPAEDSRFLSRDEFMKLSSSSGRRMRRQELDIFLDWVLDCNNYIFERTPIVREQDFLDMLTEFYPEFLGLYQSCPDGGGYWLKMLRENNLDSTRVPNVLHELAHECSAVRSNSYRGRSRSCQDWSVAWDLNAWEINPYDISTGEFVELPFMRLPGVHIMPYVTGLHGTEYADAYLSHGGVVGAFGFYGMIEEFCASAIDVRFHAISNSIKYFDSEFRLDYIANYYFWACMICEYLDALECYDSQSYQRLISDAAVMGLLRRVHGRVMDSVRYLDFDAVSMDRHNSFDAVKISSCYSSVRMQALVSEYLLA